MTELNKKKLIQWLTTPENWDNPLLTQKGIRCGYQLLLEKIRAGEFDIGAPDVEIEWICPECGHDNLWFWEFYEAPVVGEIMNLHCGKCRKISHMRLDRVEGFVKCESPPKQKIWPDREE